MYNTPELQLQAINTATAVSETLPRKFLPHQRTSFTSLGIEQIGRQIIIFDKITGKRIEDVFTKDTPFRARETDINLQMLHQLAREKAGALSVWLSPPWPGNELGKILIATTRDGLSGREIVQFDVTGPNFSRQEFDSFASWLNPFSQDGYYFLQETPVKFLRQAIPMPKVWDGIEDGSLEKKFAELVSEMIPIVQKYSGEELTEEIYRTKGADTSRACPEQIAFHQISLTKNGEILHHVKKCPCGFDVEQAKPEGIPSGWQCPKCGGTYEGC